MGDSVTRRRTFRMGVVVILLCPALAAAESPRRIAVMIPEGEAPPPVAERIAAALAAAGTGAGREVVRPAVPLDEVRLTVDCPEPGPACNAVVGRNLGVDELVLTRITREGDGWAVEVTRFEVGEGRAGRRVQRRVAAAPTDDEAQAIARDLFPAAVVPAPPPPPRRPFTVQPRTWITGAAGAALLIVGGVFGGLAHGTQSDLNGAALPPAGDRDAVRHFVDLADRGQTYATTANVFFAIGGAALVTSGVFLYLDNRRVEVQPRPGGLTLSLRGTF
ncbi:MAG TPA: hypothetical protein VGQ83_08505 [Polyangia bacterium]|jgi:hypothetical protein